MTPTEIADATTTVDNLITNVDIPDNFNDTAAWLSAVFESGAANSGLLESLFNSIELYLTNIVLVVDLVADVTDDVADYDPPVGEVVGGADNRQFSGGNRCGDGR